jgi:hypothetical protein
MLGTFKFSYFFTVFFIGVFIQSRLYSSTAPEAVEAECRVDNDCPPKLACIEAECVDPCLRRPCAPDQTCTVQNSAPLRTVICACPENTFVGPNGECKPKGIFISIQQHFLNIYLNQIPVRGWLLVLIFLLIFLCLNNVENSSFKRCLLPIQSLSKLFR